MMKYMITKLLFLFNEILLIFHMCWFVKNGSPLAVQEYVPLLISSIMLADIVYISSGNIRGNKTLTAFCALLAVDSWYVMLAAEMGGTSAYFFSVLSPAVGYTTVRFLLKFLFQGSGYRFRAITDAVLLLGCMGTWIGAVISDTAFAFMYGLQFLLNFGCLAFIMIYHRKRVLFVLKSERRYFLFSVIISGFCFAAYYLVTVDIRNHISNFGIYLPLLLFFMSIHGIALKEHVGLPILAVFGRGEAILIALLVLISGGAVAFSAGGAIFLIYINLFFMVVFFCNILLGERLRKGSGPYLERNGYQSALKQLRREEELKMEFSHFLHDDVLQDLLSVKNIIGKAGRADVQEVILQTLEELNRLIRKQMQDYHPIIRKNLTIKENYQNLIEGMAISYPQKNISISFECLNDLFLVEPYDMLIYRFLKELLNNAYKHSNSGHIWITLVQEQDMIELTVSDDGTAKADSIMKADAAEHKGISSIKEQVKNMEGMLTVSGNSPQGIKVQVMLPMKGEDSYQYFISR